MKIENQSHPGPDSGLEKHANGNSPPGHGTPGVQRAHHPHNHPVQQHGGLKSWIIGAVVLASLLAAGIAPRLRQEKKLEKLTATAASELIPVNVTVPRYESAATDLVLPGSVQAFDYTTVNARTPGYVEKWYADIGYHVRAGQVLAVIQAPELDQQLMQARAETLKSQATGQEAISDVTRLQANVMQTEAELARAESAVSAARAARAHAHAKVIQAQSAVVEARAALSAAERKLTGKKADLARANTHMKLAYVTFQRWQQLARGGAISGQDLDVSQADYESSQSAVQSAKSDVDTAQADVEAAQAAVQSRLGDVQAAQADESAAIENIEAAQATVASSQASIASSRASVQASQFGVRAAQANTQASQADFNRVNAMKGFERVVAPFNGVITARNVDVGDLVNAGSPAGATNDPSSTVPHTGLFGIARTDQLRIQVNVPEDDVRDIRVGQPAQVSIQAFPGRTFIGTVYNTSGALDASSRTELVEIRLPNPENKIVPGMYAQVHFMVHNSHALLRVPANTLIIDAAGTRVDTVGEDGKVHSVTVTLGRDFGSYVEIKSGLTGHEQLITNPTDELTDGTPVKVVAQ